MPILPPRLTPDALASLPSWARARAEVEAEREALIWEMMETWRRKASESFEAWCRLALAPFDQEPAPNHLLLIRELERFAITPRGRLMVFLPPGSGKSWYTSRLFPAWLMATCPRIRLIGAANTASLAEQFSGGAQAILSEYGPDVSGVGVLTKPAALWKSTNGGEYKAAGVRGTITSSRADVAIIDDPVKSGEEADSELIREKQWLWFRSDLRTRMRAAGKIAIVMARWHEDNLAGRLLLHVPDDWRVVQLPAVAGEGDALGRAPGAFLWDDDAGYAYGEELRAIRREYETTGDMRAWRVLHQQKPRSPESLLFKVANIATIDEAPVCTKIVRAWDLAATAATSGGPDWTVAVKFGRRDTGSYVILDVKRLRGAPEDVERAIRDNAAEDGRAVTIGLPQEPGQAGKQQVAYLTRQLLGYIVISSPESGDKATRAGPVASQVNVGNVAVVKAAWNRVLIEEMRDFPAGRKDDQIDALSRAFSLVATAPEPAKRVYVPLMGR